jgi:hypothetical protein
VPRLRLTAAACLPPRALLAGPDISSHPIFRQYAAAFQSRPPLGPTNPPSLLMSPASSVSSDLGSVLEMPLVRPRLAQHLFGVSSSTSFRKSDSLDSNASTVLDEMAASYASALIPEVDEAVRTPKAVSRTNSATCAPCNASAAPAPAAAAVVAHHPAPLVAAASIRSHAQVDLSSHPSPSHIPRPSSPLKQAYRRPPSPLLCRITVLPGKCAALPRIADLRSGCADGMLLLSATACVVAKRQREESAEAGGWGVTKRMATAES